MDRERDLLVGRVLPQVNQQLADAGVGCEVYPVDLRWGITTDDTLAPEARLRAIIDTCVDEVERCLPLVVGFIAEDLGQPVDEALLAPLLEQHHLAAPTTGLSVTSVEILYATDTAARREEIMPIIMRRKRGNSRPAPTVETFVSHLAAHGVPTHAYTDEAEGLKALEHELVHRLVSAVNRIASSQLADDWLAHELELQALAAQDSVATFVGRATERATLNHAWDTFGPLIDEPMGDDPPDALASLVHTSTHQVAVVTGKGGTGKTALLCAMASAPSERDFFHSVGIPRPVALICVGRSPHSKNLPVALLILIAQLDAVRAAEIASRTTPTTITMDDVLPVWLRIVDPSALGANARIVVDGIDDLTSGGVPTRTSDWLPPRLPLAVQLLLSVRDDGIELAPLARRPDTRVLALGDLTADDAADLVRTRLTRSHKTVPEELIRQITHRSRNPRWLVVASQLLVTLRRHDYLSLNTPDLAALEPEDAILRLLEGVVSDLSASLDGLYEEVIGRLEECYDVTVLVLAMLGIATSGLRDSDLIATISQFRPIDHADLALARSLLAEMVDVVDDRWSFSHNTVRQAIEDVIVAASEEVGVDVATAFRVTLARHLSGLPLDDAVREQELLLLVLWEEEFSLLARALADETLTNERTISNMLGTLCHYPVDAAIQLLDSADGDEMTMAVAFAVCNVAPFYPYDEMVRLYDHIEELIAPIDPQTRSRFGVSPADLLHLVSITRLDAFGQPVMGTSLGDTVARLSETRSNIGQSLASIQALVSGSSQAQDGLRAWPALILLISVSLDALATDGPIAASMHSDGAETAKELIAGVRALATGGKLNNSFGPTVLMLIDVAESCCAELWPGRGFVMATSLVSDAEALMRTRPGELDSLTVLIQAYRLTALKNAMLVPHEAEVWTDAEARAMAAAIDAMESALWRLDSQLVISPGSTLVKQLRFTVGHMALAVFAQARLHVRAWDVARWLAVDETTRQLLPPADHLHLVASGLFEYLQTFETEPADDVIRAASVILDQAPPPGWESGEPRVLFELELLAAAVKSGFSHLNSSGMTLAAVERTIGLFSAGVLPHTAKSDFSELIDDQLVSVAEEVAELTAEDLRNPEVRALMAFLERLEGLRMLI